MAFSMTGGGASRPQINVTPLIDVLLTLIIVFMVVVGMDPQYGDEAQIPQPPKDDKTVVPEPICTVVIEVVWTARDQPPTVKINREDVRWEDLETRLARIYVSRVEKVAFVRGDADVDFQYVADVIDVVHHVGVQRVGLLTQGRMLEGE